MTQSIISDSTTIITLLNIDRLDILTNLFDKVVLPQSVYKEVVAGENVELDIEFFVIKKAKDKKLLKILQSSLDAGESEAIVLAIEKELSLVIDEKKGRKIASKLGINIVGLLGLIILNYKKDLITDKEAAGIFSQAKDQGFRVSLALEHQFLETVGY